MSDFIDQIAQNMPEMDLMYLYDQYQKKFHSQRRYKNRWQWWGEAQSSKRNSFEYDEEESPIRVDVGTGVDNPLDDEDILEIGDHVLATNETPLNPIRI